MPVKYLILGGGGYMGLSALGALYELHQERFYHINNIERIYATSIGAFLGTMLCLKIEWDIMIDYIKDRPWHKIISFTPDMLFDTMTKKGVFDISFFRESFLNLLKSVDLNIDITLQELYEYSKIDLHIFSTELNNMNLIDFNYKAYPNVKVIDAIYMSSTLPFVFQPLWYHDSYYLDGGLLNNYPLDICIGEDCDLNEILGIQYNLLAEPCALPKNAHLLEFSFFLYKNFFRTLRKEDPKNIENEIIIPCDPISINECKRLLEEATLREKYIMNGRKAARLFLTYRKI